MKIRRLLQDSAVYGAGQLVYLGLPVLLVPLYSRLLSPAEYGIVELVTVAGVLVNFLVPMEIGQGLARHFVDSRDPQARSDYAATALLFTLGAYLPFLLAGWALAAQLAQLLFGDPALAASLRLGIVAICATGIFIGVLNQLRWQLTPVPFLMAAAAFALASAGVSLWLLWGGGGPDAVFVGQTAGACLGAAIAGWFARPSYRGARFSGARLREMLGYSLPLVLSSTSVFLLQFADRFVLKELTDVATVGLYSVGGRLASAANLVLIGLSAALTPLIFESHARPETPASLARIFRGFVAAALIALMAGSVFTPELLEVVAGAQYLAAWQVIPPLAFASVLARMYIFAPGLDIAKRTGVIMTINVAAALVAVACCYLWIPGLGMMGAAAAMLAGSACAFTAYMAFSQSLYPVPHAWGPLGAATGIAVAVVLASLFAQPAASLPPAALIGVKGLAVAAGAGAIMWVLGFTRRVSG